MVYGRAEVSAAAHARRLPGVGRAQGWLGRVLRQGDADRTANSIGENACRTANGTRRSARREQEAFWAGGNAAIADELFAPQVTEGDGRVLGPADLTAMMQMQRAAVPDVQIRVEAQVAEGDLVVSRLEITGTHLGEWQGVPATGKRFTISGLVMRRIAGGKIVERWDNLDWMGFYQQLGLISAM